MAKKPTVEDIDDAIERAGVMLEALKKATLESQQVGEHLQEQSAHIRDIVHKAQAYVAVGMEPYVNQRVDELESALHGEMRRLASAIEEALNRVTEPVASVIRGGLD